MSILCPKCKQELSVTDASGDSSGLSCPNCGTVVDIFNPETIVAGQSQPPLHPGDRPMPKIEGYEILNVLGEGGMGIVYEGLHTSLNRKVAIKVLAPHLSRDSQFVSRFEREIDVLVKARHPNIVIIFDRSKPGADTLYYIMEYVEGKDGSAHGRAKAHCLRLAGRSHHPEADFAGYRRIGIRPQTGHNPPRCQAEQHHG